MKVKVNGKWEDIKTVQTKVNGKWVPTVLQGVLVKVNGKWEKP